MRHPSQPHLQRIIFTHLPRPIWHGFVSLGLCMSGLPVLTLSAQGVSPHTSHPNKNITYRLERRKARLYRSPLAILTQRYTAQLDSMATRSRQTGSTGNDSLQTDTIKQLQVPDDPYCSMLFSGATFYPGVTASYFRLAAPAQNTFGRGSTSRHIYSETDAVDKAWLYVYTHKPWLVTTKEAEGGTINVDKSIQKSVNSDDLLTERFAQGAHYKGDKDEVEQIRPGSADDWGIVVRKPNFWTFKSNLSFQFTQNYVSDNWYKGGESNQVFLAQTQLEANYNNQKKLTFNNKLEMKLGFQSTANDDEHRFKPSSDLLRMTNKLGLRAIEHWYYTVMLQSWTQFCRGYKANDKKIYSDFMSPFESLLSIGMDYQVKSKSGKFSLNATLSPIAVNLKYVNRESLVTSFGVNEGHHSRWTYGSNITVNYTWNVIKNVSWTGRLYWFTNYEKTQIEWENTINLTINRYLSTRLFLYPRFDDSVQRKEGDSYLQFNELLSLGFNFNF